MKYIANPVEVDAQIIISCGLPDGIAVIAPDGSCLVTLQDGSTFRCDNGMIARYIPQPGDYLVTQSDGYVYLNPKEVFERKYAPKALASNA